MTGRPRIDPARLAPGSQRRFHAAGHGSTGTKARGTMRTAIELPAYHPAVRGGRTLFPSRVYAPDEVKGLLKSGQHSRKIGRVVTKGKRRGWPIYTLTLEERATCPRSCLEWQSCYGNHMHAAERIEHGEAMLEPLALELCDLARAHPQGFLIRLHVLGDFWSADYVRFWGKMLEALPMMAVFGFTAHDSLSETGLAIVETLDAIGWQRFSVRFSGAVGANMAARVVDHGRKDPEAIACPAQTGGTDCCATCGLCWHSTRSIAFERH